MNNNYLIFVSILIFLLAFLFISQYQKENYSQHPVLKYQREASQGNAPAVLGDPIRPATIASRSY